MSNPQTANAAPKTAWEKWMAISVKAATILLMVILFLFYFTVFLPFAVLFRIFADPLRLSAGKTAAGSFFIPRKRVTETRETAANPF